MIGGLDVAGQDCRGKSGARVGRTGRELMQKAERKLGKVGIQSGHREDWPPGSHATGHAACASEADLNVGESPTLRIFT